MPIPSAEDRHFGHRSECFSPVTYADTCLFYGHMSSSRVLLGHMAESRVRITGTRNQRHILEVSRVSIRLTFTTASCVSSCCSNCRDKEWVQNKGTPIGTPPLLNHMEVPYTPRHGPSWPVVNRRDPVGPVGPVVDPVGRTPSDPVGPRRTPSDPVGPRRTRHVYKMHDVWFPARQARRTPSDPMGPSRWAPSDQVGKKLYRGQRCRQRPVRQPGDLYTAHRIHMQCHNSHSSLTHQCQCKRNQLATSVKSVCVCRCSAPEGEEQQSRAPAVSHLTVTR